VSSALKDQGDSKQACGHTNQGQSHGSKQIKCEHLQTMGQGADIGKVPVHTRIYMKDYTKVAPEKDDTDAVGPFLGNPLRW
jgi:hypothetical protein